jgi:hypothetical protein
MIKDLTTLEQTVMQALLDGDDDILSILREQLKSTLVVKRKMTGVGFYTTFEVSADVPRAGDESFKFGDVVASIFGLKHGAGFLLYVKLGVLQMLEGYSYDEPWPQETSEFKLSYTSGQQRNTEALHKLLHGNGPMPN